MTKKKQCSLPTYHLFKLFLLCLDSIQLDDTVHYPQYHHLLLASVKHVHQHISELAQLQSADTSVLDKAQDDGVRRDEMLHGVNERLDVVAKDLSQQLRC